MNGLELPAEDEITPSTLNEIRLINRIRQLQRIGYMHGPEAMVRGVVDPNDLALSFNGDAPKEIKLYRAAGVEVIKDPIRHPGSIEVTARSYGPKGASLGISRYVTQESLRALRPGGAASMLTEIYRVSLNEFARFLDN